MTTRAHYRHMPVTEPTARPARHLAAPVELPVITEESLAAADVDEVMGRLTKVYCFALGRASADLNGLPAFRASDLRRLGRARLIVETRLDELASTGSSEVAGARDDLAHLWEVIDGARHPRTAITRTLISSDEPRQLQARFAAAREVCWARTPGKDLSDTDRAELTRAQDLLRARLDELNASRGVQPAPAANPAHSEPKVASGSAGKEPTDLSGVWARLELLTEQATGAPRTWTEAVRLVAEHRNRLMRTPESRERLLVLVSMMVVKRLPHYRTAKGWDERCGAFLCELGLGRDGIGADEVFADWDWDQPNELVARFAAWANLRDALDRDKAWTASYVGELISIGWRTAYLERLRTLFTRDSETSALARWSLCLGDGSSDVERDRRADHLHALASLLCSDERVGSAEGTLAGRDLGASISTAEDAAENGDNTDAMNRAYARLGQYVTPKLIWDTWLCHVGGSPKSKPADLFIELLDKAVLSDD